MNFVAGFIIACVAAVLAAVGSKDGPRGMLVLLAMFLVSLATSLMAS